MFLHVSCWCLKLGVSCSDLPTVIASARLLTGQVDISVHVIIPLKAHPNWGFAYIRPYDDGCDQVVFFIMIVLSVSFVDLLLLCTCIFKK